MKMKRLIIALVVSTIFGILCAYGTSTVEIPEFEVTMPYLFTIFYARLLIGFFVGLGDNVNILRGEYKNSVLRGAIFGIITSITISFYGGAGVFIAAGIVYGVVADLVATRLS